MLLLSMCSLGTMVGCLIFYFLNAEGGSKGWVIGTSIGFDGSVIQRELFLDLLPLSLKHPHLFPFIQEQVTQEG